MYIATNCHINPLFNENKRLSCNVMPSSCFQNIKQALYKACLRGHTVLLMTEGSNVVGFFYSEI